MAIVNIKVGKREFKLSCGEGQEEHLKRIASQFAKRVEKISAGLNSGGDSLLLVMAALTLQEEVNNFTKNPPDNNEVEINKLHDTVNSMQNKIDKLLQNI